MIEDLQALVYRFLSETGRLERKQWRDVTFGEFIDWLL